MKIQNGKTAIFACLLIFAAASVLALAGSPPAHAGAVPLVGDYRPPPAGTRFEMTNYTATVKSVGPYEFMYRIVDSSGAKNTIFTSLFVVNLRGEARVVGRDQAHSDIWPLKVGR